MPLRHMVAESNIRLRHLFRLAPLLVEPPLPLHLGVALIRTLLGQLRTFLPRHIQAHLDAYGHNLGISTQGCSLGP